MAILIVAGLGTLVTVIVRRAALAPPMVATAAIVLREPPGTRIAGASGPPDAMVLTLQGGGPDRVLVVDGRSGLVLRRLQLAP